ncbi:Apc15p protein-domain-containing protein [Phialemonium atrogriseum]|uniref:Apc15p protein-domain-containing protein n=1 Tax=Phialemonium atrogriseum TaxID=1093897 RepID=A0AAJ0FRS0_9PEZI|nr:Apc15p protein-domain-containing protein [Phialemonium atrogriseum]KAK1772558.1 Apc15p protein-domain-containing protein [Phialemonium atrogriseum]
MLSLLPDLTPRDSHSLWYTSSRNPNQLPPHLDPEGGNPSSAPGGGPSTGPRPARPTTHSAAAAAVERSALARLRADEAYMERRRLNVSNFGATWLKPPGVVKSLFQMREERREQEEHAEALRREQLALELAEAEAEAAGAGALGLDDDDEEGLEGGEAMDEDVVGGGRDLDDDIPDADEGGFGFDGASDDDDEEEGEDDDDDDDGDGGVYGGHGTGAAQQRRAQQRELANRLATVRAAEDRARERMVRGQDVGSDIYGGEEELDNEDPSQMLEEDDLVHMSHHHQHEVEPGMDLDMDADLDDDIPEAESGVYEHTDTEAELGSSSDDGGQNTSFAGARAPPASRFGSSLVRSDGARTSLDINSILSRDGSSLAGSSPQVRRRNHLHG